MTPVAVTVDMTTCWVYAFPCSQWQQILRNRSCETDLSSKVWLFALAVCVSVCVCVRVSTH